ncbi:MAG: sugar transporter [Sphingomicrobium sp.]
MEQAIQSPPPPRWFTAAAIAALLFELAGCGIFAMQMAVDPASLPLDQRAMWEAAPSWMLVAYGVAVATGLVGAVLLVMRRRLAVKFLLLSLAAILIQFSALLVVPQLRNLTASDDLFLPFVIIVAAFIILNFARTAAARGWLR